MERLFIFYCGETAAAASLVDTSDIGASLVEASLVEPGRKRMDHEGDGKLWKINDALPSTD